MKTAAVLSKYDEKIVTRIVGDNLFTLRYSSSLYSFTESLIRIDLLIDGFMSVYVMVNGIPGNMDAWW